MRARLLLALAASLLACAHADSTGSPTARDAAEGEVQAPPAKMAVTPKTEAGHPNLAASPDELMKPGSRAKIGQALQAKGYLRDASASGNTFLEAVKAFQKSQGLAQTGYADHETLSRLGINPSAVDKSLEETDAKEAKRNGTAPEKDKK